MRRSTKSPLSAGRQLPDDSDKKILMRILLIEDDTLIGDGIKAGLTHQGFDVTWFTSGSEGKNTLSEGSFDAVILDLTLPGEDGLVILRQWREAGRTEPVLVLTARDALDQRVKGLELGADDYLGKPFALEELNARLKALVRRSTGQTSPLLVHGSITLCLQSKTLKKDGGEVPLSPKELALIELFLRNRENVLPKSLIEDKLYQRGEDISSNAVEVHIHHLRRKLGQETIKTVYGFGYVLGNPL